MLFGGNSSVHKKDRLGIQQVGLYTVRMTKYFFRHENTDKNKWS